MNAAIVMYFNYHHPFSYSTSSLGVRKWVEKINVITIAGLLLEVSKGRWTVLERNRKLTEFHYRSMKEGETILVLLGTEYSEEPEYKSEDISKKHFHNLMEVAICREGKGKVLFDFATLKFEPGTILVIPQNMSHAIMADTKENCFWEYLYINPFEIIQQADLKEREKKKYLDQANNNFVVKNKDSVPFLEREINLIMDQLRVKEHGYHRIVSGMAYVLLQEIIKIDYYSQCENDIDIRYRKNKQKHVTNILDYIDDCYDKKICVADIAKATYTSPTSLRKIFKDNFMMSPMQYVNYVRVEKACELMKKSDENVEIIARRVGYDNLSTFINNFKLFTGKTPKQWKKSYI